MTLGYAPHAIVSHPPRRNWTELRTKFERIDRETFAWTIATNTYGRLTWLLRSFALLLSIPPHGLKVMTSPRLTRPADRLSALAMLVRQRLWRFFHAWRLFFTQGRP